VTVGAGVANTAVQGKIVLPQPMKIVKVAVDLDAIDAVTGDSFNIVVGKGAYVQANALASNDDFPINGYTSNFAPLASSLFYNDVAFTVANFPNLTVGTGTGNTGQVLFPYNTEVVYPAGTVLTLRTTTNPTTGALTRLVVTLLGEVIDPVPQKSEAFVWPYALGSVVPNF